MNEFSDIGFTITNREEAANWGKRVYKDGQRFECEEGVYCLLADNSGAMLCAQYLRDSEGVPRFHALRPHFASKKNRSVYLTKSFARAAKDDLLCGGYYCWDDPDDRFDPGVIRGEDSSANTNESGHDTGLYSMEHPVHFLFDVPDFYRSNVFKCPKRLIIDLVAFPVKYTIYETENAFFNVHRRKGLRLAANYFLPGDVPRTGSESAAPQGLASCSMAGKITQMELRTNRLSNSAFYWLSVENCRGEFDVLLASDTVVRFPKAGNIIDGVFNLSGRILGQKRRSQKKHGEDDIFTFVSNADDENEETSERDA